MAVRRCRLSRGLTRGNWPLAMTDTVCVATGETTRRNLVLLTLCLGVLIAQIDTSVVNLAVQPIGARFGASVSALQWVLDAYNLVYAALLLTGGLVADLYGRRPAFPI